MLVLFCWTWGFPWVLKFKFSFFFRPWKVLKLDTGAEKVLIFVHCGPDKPNHSSDISVMWFPWSWSWHVTVTMCYGLVSELVRCVYSALESVTMLWHPQKLLWHYYLLLLSLFSQSILKAINSTTIIPDFSIFLVLKGPEKSWNSSLEVWTLWTVEDMSLLHLTGVIVGLRCDDAVTGVIVGLRCDAVTGVIVGLRCDVEQWCSSGHPRRLHHHSATWSVASAGEMLSSLAYWACQEMPLWGGEAGAKMWIWRRIEKISWLDKVTT